MARLLRYAIVVVLFTFGYTIKGVLAQCDSTFSNFQIEETWEQQTITLWNNVSGNDYDWIINSGGTPTNNSGPSGAYAGSYYIYTETSGTGTNEVGIMESECLAFPTNSAPYLSFRLHMYENVSATTAQSMGYLQVQVNTNPSGNSWSTLATYNTSSNSWLEKFVDLSAYAGSTIKLRFRAVTGTLGGFNQWYAYGDRALDNIIVSTGVNTTNVSCSGGSNGSATAVGAFNGVGSTLYTYLWSTGGTTQTITGLSAGSYACTITDTSSNSEVVSFSITEPTLPAPQNLSATSTSICETENEVVTLSIDFASGDYTFSTLTSDSSDLGSQNTAGTSQIFNIFDAPAFATGDATLTMYYRGDMEAAAEYVTTYSENGTSLGSSTPASGQCSGSYNSVSFSIDPDSINDWASDGVISLQGIPTGMTRYCNAGSGNYYSWNAYYTLSYPVAQSTPYWFTNNCDSVLANAVDSGYTIDVTPTTTTTYYVRFYDTTCDQWGTCDSVTVTVNGPPTVAISPTSPYYCGTPISITASGGSFYSWSPGTGLNQTSGPTVIASPSITTAYEVVGIDGNGCTDTAAFSITVTTGPSASVTGTNVTCNGGSNGTASVTASGGTSSYTYLWSNGSTSTSLSGLSAGTYTVTVDDGTTCQAVQSIVITEPTALSITIAGNNIGCSGFSTGSAFAFVTGGTASYSYSWSNGSTSNVAFALAAGTYTLTVTDANSCTATQSVTITQPSSALSTTISSTTNVSCNGGNDGSATVTASGGTPTYGYSWSSGATSATASNLSAGTYIVTVTDANGCVSVAVASITQPATAVSVSIGSPTNVTCNGGSNGSATASGSGGTGTITYAWSSGSTSATAGSLSAGTYTVTATDANGCTDTESITITEPTAVTAGLSVTNVLCNGGSNGSITAAGSGGNGGAYSYVWSTGGTSGTVSGLSAGTYTLTITDNAGCTGTETTTVTEPSVLTASTTLGNNVSCNGGNNGSATASATGGTSGYAYNWSSGSTAATASSLSAGTYTVTVTDANGCTDTETITITEPATAVSTSIGSPTNVSCNGGNDGAATASGAGGTPGYSYSWSSGATSAAASSLSAGTYTVTVTDANGCTDTETVIITEPATAVTASISLGSNVSCNGGSSGSATASATGGTPGYSYTWSSGSSTASASGLAAGTYTVTVTDANGCTDTETITITQPAALVASTTLGSNVSCNGGNNGTASASASGGTPGYSYAWSSGSTSASASSLSAGTCTVTVTDAQGCTDTETITITEPSVLVASTTLGSNVSCNGGNDGSATASASGGTSAYSYAWSSGSNVATASSLSAGTYTVTITDANGCTDTETITITEPVTALTASIGSPTNVSCNGGNDGSATASGAGGTSPYSYSWSSGSTAATASSLSAGTYTVTVTDANGCTDTETVTITEPATSVTASIGSPTNVSCNGGGNGSATASGSGGTPGYSFSWSSGSTTATASSLSAGTYTVTVTDANGCTDTESVTITQPTVLIASTALGSNASCNGANDGSASASAAGGTPGYSYNWSSGSTSTSATGLSAGTYTVTVTDANGCTDTETITITEPAILVASTTLGSNVSCNGGNDGSATASASGGTSAYSYAWSSGSNVATASSLSAGTYTVTITDANGCTDTETITITEPVTALTASIGSPTNVSCNGGNDGSATASGAGGTSPYSYSWSSGSTAATASSLSAGTYTVTVTDANGCTDTENVTITEPATAVSASITLVSNVSCNGGNDGSATASGSGGTAGYTYSWSSGASTATASSLSAGTHTVTVTDDNGCTDTETITITEPAVLVASTTLGSNVSCNGGSDGSASASAAGGTSPYGFSWSSGSTTSSATSLSAGTYTVTVTDANGCSDTETITITEPAVLVASTTLGNNVSCNGGNDGSATASAVGGTSPYSYSWTSGSTSASASSLSAGTYTVTVTDANGCTDTETITITEPTLLVAAIDSSSNISCFGLFDGVAHSSASGGTSPYSFAWSSGAATSTASGLGAGTFTVTVTDANGCTDTESVTISQPTLLVASASVDNDVSCNGGNDGQATASGSGGTPGYSYSWSSGAATAVASSLSAGNYTVTITDLNGCSDTASVTISEPTLLVASTSLGNNVDCNGGNNGAATASAAGGTSPYSYSWSSGSTSVSATGLSAGTYTVTITDANGCSDTSNITITEPTLLVATGSGVNVSCNGTADGQASVAASGGTSPYTYLWSTGSTLSSATNLGPGTYGVTVTDDNGCTATASISITQPSVLIASISLDSNVSCNGGNDGSATASAVGGTSGYTYAWSSGASSSTASSLASGTYTVTVTDANGCTDTETITISEPTLLSTTTTVLNNVSCYGGFNGNASISASGATSPHSYAWSSGATTTNATNLTAGTYYVTVTDAMGCEAIDSVSITEPDTLIATASMVNGVSCNGGNDGSVTVSTTGGTTAYGILWSNGSTSTTVTGLSAGTYTVTVTDANGCVDTSSAEVTQPDSLVAGITLGSNVSCNGGNDGSVTASGTGGASPYAFLWSTSSTSASISGLTAGTYTVTITDANNCTSIASISITEPATLAASAVAVNNVLCSGQSSGTVAGSASGGTSPFSFLWSTSNTTDTVSGLVAGTYTLTITDANGCTDTASATIIEPSAVSAQALWIMDAACNGSSTGSAYAVAAGGTTPYSYAWVTGSTNDSIFNLSAGTYTVTITDANGCSDSDTVSILEPAALALNFALADPLCNGSSDGSITSIVTGGTTPYTYSWSTSASSAGLSGLSAGSYTLTVTDANGCTTALNGQLNNPTSVVASITSQNNSCFGDSTGFAVANGSGGAGNFSFTWSTGSTNDTLASAVAGTYTVTVTDSNGCFATASVTLTQPTALTASISFTDSVACFGDSSGLAVAAATGGTSPYSYSWPASWTSSNDSLLNVPVGGYTVTITDDNGCTDTAVAVIDQYPALVLMIDSTQDVTCFNGMDGYASVLASGGAGGYTYAWPNGSTSAINDSLSGGVHCVTVTDANGCSDTACVDLSELNPLPPVNIGNDTAICDTLFTLDAGSAVGYSWSTGATSQTIQIDSTDDYSVTITNAIGCQNSDTISVTFNPLISFDVETDSTSCGGATGAALVTNLIGGGGYTLLWSSGQLNTLNVSSLTYGAYSVTVNDANGCSAEQSFFIYDDTDLSFDLFATDASCYGLSDGSAWAAVTSGTSPFSFNWSNGAVTDSILNITANTYALTVTDSAGCILEDSIAVNQPDNILLSVVSTGATCGDSNGTAAVNVFPNATYSFAWNDPFTQTTDTASNLPAGTYQVIVTAANGCQDSAFAIVSNDGAPVLALTAMNESCEGSGDGYTAVSATSLSPLTYLWSDALGQTTDTAFSIGSGLYFVSVTDTSGCIAIDSISVGADGSNPVFTLGNDTSVCSSSITLYAPMGMSSYAWSTGSTSDSILVTATGQYWVNVTNASGCSSTDSIQMDLYNAITYTSAVNNSSCSQNTGAIDITVTAGNGGYTFLWNTGDTTALISGLGSGTYDVTIADSAGCSIEASFIVDNINAPEVSVDVTDANCNAEASGSATATVTNGTSPFIYAWSNGGIGTNQSGLLAGIYDLTVTDDSGCLVIVPFNVLEPTAITISISGIQPDCGDSNGSALALVSNTQGPVTSYLWNDSAATPLPFVNNLPAGYYTVSITDSAGCSASESIALSNLGAASLAIYSTTNNCSNENIAYAYVDAFGSGPFTYAWNDDLSQQNDTAFSLYNGTYAISVTDTNGCIAVGDVEVTSIFTAPSISLGGDVTSCIGNEVILTPGNGFVTYLWNTGNTSPSITVTAGQSYSVTVSNAVGCAAADTALVAFVAPPVVDLGNDTIVCVDDFSPVVTLDAGEGFNNYLWSTSDTTQSIDVFTGGLYKVSVSDVPGCIGTDQVIVAYDTCINVTTADLGNGSNASLRIYPNPNRGRFMVEMERFEAGNYDVQVLNAAGQHVLITTVRTGSSGVTIAELDLSEAPRGIYLMTIKGLNIRIDQRVIIQ